MTTGSDELPEFARALAIQIIRGMEELAEELRASGDHPRTAEARAFRKFDSLLVRALDRYRPVPTQAREHQGLVFQELYNDAKVQPGPPGDRSYVSTALAALMAALVESYGPTRLTRFQTTRLAVEMQSLGEVLLVGIDLPEHAAAAFDRAAQLYAELGDLGGANRCRRRLTTARRRTAGHGRRPVTARSLIPRIPISRYAPRTGTPARLIAIVLGTVAAVALLTYLVEKPLSHAGSPVATWTPVATAVLAVGLVAWAALSRRGTAEAREWILVAAMASLAAACYLTSYNATRSVLAAARPLHVIEPTSAAQLVTAIGGLVTAVGLSTAAVIKAVALLIQARGDLIKARRGIESGGADNTAAPADPSAPSESSGPQ